VVETWFDDAIDVCGLLHRRAISKVAAERWQGVAACSRSVAKRAALDAAVASS